MNDIKSINLIVEKLYSKNTEEALFALNKIRNSRNQAILPNIIDFLNNGQNKEIRTGIIDLLNDLKIQAATSEIIHAVKNNKSQDTQKILLTSCWQSGLDYSEHLEFFIDLFISAKFEFAFEAFTIIENMQSKISKQIIEKMTNKLKIAAADIGKEKHDLLVELIHILNNMKFE